MATAARTAGDSSFRKGVDVLSAVVDGGPHRVDELAAQTGLPSSTVYRFVRTLVETGFLEARDGVYHLGSRLVALQGKDVGLEWLRRLATPLMHRLVQQTEESAVLTVRSGMSALVVETVDSPQLMRLSFTKGTVRPLHAGASAKVLLAFSSDDVVRSVLSRELERFSAGTPDRQALTTQIPEIRSQGYVVTTGEVDPYASAVGVPVFRGGELACGLSVAGPQFRLRGRESELVAAARRVAEALQAAIDEPLAAAEGA
ncbi:MAG: helix-turn-helix domain-containing protein [Streptosporangiales bacterium]|nr:helix-turn-helix domain-containing protein [Streptosporangiales bacterium]